MLKKLLSVALASLSFAAMADVSVSGLFTDHAVLAKSEKTPVFGKAAAGEVVTVSIAGQKGNAIAGGDGKWRVNLDLSKVGEGPFELLIQGKNTIKVQDVLVGEVWLCSGQSNMGFQLRSEERAKELIAESANPKIRLFQLRIHASVTPEEDVAGSWRVVAPDNVGNFTAVGYLFGKYVQAELGCPMGLINNAWGGSAVEGWVTRDFLKGNDALEEWCDKTYNNFVAYDGNVKTYLEQFNAWLKSNNLEAPTDNVPPAKAQWKDNQGIYGWNKLGPAIVWYRKKVTFPESFTKSGGRFNFYQHGANVAFFLDGNEIAHSTPEGEIKGSSIVSKVFKPGEIAAGEHELSIRYWCLYDGFATSRLGYKLPGEISLNSGYQSTIIPIKLTPEQLASRPKRPGLRPDENKIPEIIYNALINPLKPYRLSGCVWYQGCSNAGRPTQYPTAIQGLIKEWRRDFESEFPFYYCQLANYLAKDADPNKQGWADIRVGQEGALAMPKTGQAILIDCGESGDIHPIDKITPSKRLAAVALAKTYGKNIPYSGPVFKSKNVEGSKIRIAFDFVEGGLEARPLPETYFVQKTKGRTAPLVRNSPDSELEGFALAGADGKWFWANAKIDGDTVVVWSDKVAAPVSVRYAYQSNPTCNLYNKAGFPAVPFSK
ncbi:MAG: hypothetical protein IKR81_13695 [Victivallales bacterium]|nr:hypothetical protein [Victivallales bacterium]